MQVAVEESGVIERKLTISVPAEKIETEVAKRLKKVAKNARIHGFRPGKAPHSIIKKRYSPQVTDEVINETIHVSYTDALNQEKINPAGLVSIEPIPYESGKALTYIATIELFPQIPTPTLEGKTIEKPMVEVIDENVHEFLEDIRKRSADFVAKNGKSAVGDRLTIDFESKIKGELFEGDGVTDFSFVLGDEQMLAQFNAGLVGLNAGESKTIAFVFPENHGNPEVANKEAEFAVTVKSVEKPVLPALNDDFAKLIGVKEGGIEQMKQEIRTNLQQTLDVRIRHVLRERVLDALYVANDIETPKALVETAIDIAVKEVAEQLADRGLPADKINRDDYIDEAKKRVALALIVRAVAEKFKIEGDPEAVRAKVMELPTYSDESGGYAGWCRANTDTLKHIEAIEFEDQVVACLLETATVKQQNIPFKTFMSVAI